MSALASIDGQDLGLLERRKALMDELPGPRVGDYVRFADGVERRISFVTPAEWMPECDSVQTSKGGSFYLGEHGCSFSGSLYTGVKRETLTLTSESRLGSVWFFHHDYAMKANGVDASVLFDVYECSEEATR